MDALLLDISLNSEQRGWIALAVAVVCISYLLFRPKFRKKDPLEKPAFGSLASQRSVERQMQNLLVELSEMTRQMNAQIDTRAKRLEQLIQQADQRIATLRGLDGAPNSKPTANPRPKPPEPISDDIGHPPTAGPPTAPDPRQESDRSQESDPRHAEIYSLADAGKAPREIASQLGRPSGEVELILALRPRS
jgi:hypothetical protein